MLELISTVANGSDDYHHRINEETTSAAINKSERTRNIGTNMTTELEDINEFNTELEGLEKERDNVVGEITKIAKAKQVLSCERKRK